MRARWLVAAGLFAGTAGAFAGCDKPAASSTGTGTTRPDRDKKADIHITGPKGGSVDVEAKEGGGAKVEVRRPGTGR